MSAHGLGIWSPFPMQVAAHVPAVHPAAQARPGLPERKLAKVSKHLPKQLQKKSRKDKHKKAKRADKIAVAASAPSDSALSNKPRRQKSAKCVVEKLAKEKRRTKKHAANKTAASSKVKGKSAECKKKNREKTSAVQQVLLGQSAEHKAKFEAAKSIAFCRSAAAFLVFRVLSVAALDPVGGSVHRSVMEFLAVDLRHGAHAARVFPGMLAAAVPALDPTLGLALMLTAVVLTGLRNRASGCQLHDFIEFSAGSGMLTLQCLLCGFSGVALDKQYGRHQDNTSAHGLNHWMNQLVITRRNALTWFGTQCSSFSAMCINNSDRRVSNCFLGCEADFVLEGNFQMQATALLALVSHLLGNTVVLEQPYNSCMPKAPPLVAVFEYFGPDCHNAMTYHGSFGAASWKPLQLVSNSARVSELVRPRPKFKSKQLAKRGPNGSYSGDSARLLQSQCYTADFAKTVANVFLGPREII